MPSLSLDDDNRSLNSKIASSREQSVSCDRFSDCTFHAQRKGCTRFRNYDLYFLGHFISLAIILDQNSIHMSRCCSVSLARGLFSFAKTQPSLKLMTAEWPLCSKNVQGTFDHSDRPSDNNSFQRSPLQPERRNVMFCAHATSTHSRLRSCIEIKSTHGPAVRLMCIAETSNSISFFFKCFFNVVDGPGICLRICPGRVGRVRTGFEKTGAWPEDVLWRIFLRQTARLLSHHIPQ